MVKFARAILLQMRVLKFRLAERLGEGTKDLELRIGLHSGSITAGYVSIDESVVGRSSDVSS